MNFKDAKKESEDRNHKNDGSTLYVSNLSSKITTARLQDIFEKFGNIEKCYVISNPITRESRNFGFVTFNSSHEAHNALSKANKMEVEGRIINVEIAKRNEPHEPTPGEYKGVQNMVKRNGIRHDFYGKKYDRSYDRRRYESRRANPYNKERIKNFGSRDNSYRNYDKYGRNRYSDYRNYDRRSNDNRYHKKNEYYKRNNRSSDDEKGYSRDESKKKKRYEKNRKSSSASNSERRRYRNSPIDRSPRYRRK
ncbi:RNA-binding protein, putative [Plasmodium relictum]|uniref:RNA-binding protein, putative n=1 Tax=Plasmodium relictum TaxID=85471 RepID=A0A1J1H819_PLARL|nr:RNA-binding protein, putative [Plasmodium relictum]CRG99576.1 RNA-binding protein, putative [Plasmodium relictum]